MRKDFYAHLDGFMSIPSVLDWNLGILGSQDFKILGIELQNQTPSQQNLTKEQNVHTFNPPSSSGSDFKIHLEENTRREWTSGGHFLRPNSRVWSRSYESNQFYKTRKEFK